MTYITSIDTPAGTATIDTKVFTHYTKESHDLLESISELTKDFKDLVETVSETTKLDKGIVGKYLKARYKESTKEAKDLGDVFSTLDGILA
jgi:hypothetical protein